MTIKNLTNYPLVNIIIPAWKEGEIFRGCLSSVFKLKYPNLKVITNVGGSEKTLQIARSFDSYENLIILEQKEGYGKVKAINDALNKVFEGIVVFIDADIYLTNDVFIKSLYYIIEMNYDVVCTLLKPHRSQIKDDLTSLVYINRYARHKKKLNQFRNSITPFSCIKYEVIQAIGKFPERQLLGDGKVMGTAIINQKYKIYRINQFVESFNYPNNIKSYFHQNIRWIENRLSGLYKDKKLRLITIFFYLLACIYLFVFPFLITLNFGLFLIGIFLYINFYLKKIRNYIFYITTTRKSDSQKVSVRYFIKLFYYVYLEIIVNLLAIIEFVFYKKKYKARKNIS
ncbi:MAG: glycosyltransferase [Candidatus Thorarchaeota archaeon]